MFLRSVYMGFLLNNTLVTLTWVKAVAGDPSPLQSVCQLPSEEHITELAVAVRPDGVQPRRLAPHQVLLRRQQGTINSAQAVEKRRHGNHTARGALLQSLQQKVCEKEMPKVVHPKRHAKAVLCVPGTHHTCKVACCEEVVPLYN